MRNSDTLVKRTSHKTLLSDALLRHCCAALLSNTLAISECHFHKNISTNFHTTHHHTTNQNVTPQLQNTPRKNKTANITTYITTDHCNGEVRLQWQSATSSTTATVHQQPQRHCVTPTAVSTFREKQKEAKAQSFEATCRSVTGRIKLHYIIPA